VEAAPPDAPTCDRSADPSILGVRATELWTQLGMTPVFAVGMTQETALGTTLATLAHIGCSPA